jgi:predicted O-methyltransferase YrrM
VADVPGMLSAAECDALVFAGMLAPGRGDIIEIGSWLGRSTLHLAHACKASGRGRVHALDTFQGNAGFEKLYHRNLGRNATIFEAFQENIARSGLSEWVVPHVGKAEETRSEFRDPVRMVFIDGCHEYEPVKRDVRLWKDLLLPGGLLVLHDFRAEAKGSVAAVSEEVFGAAEFRVLMLVDSLLIAEKRAPGAS